MTTNNLQLQALIAEQKALTAKFEELLNSTTEDSSTLDPKKVYIKGHPTRGAEVIKMLEDLGGENVFDYGGERFDRAYFLMNEMQIGQCKFVERIFNNYTELHLPEENAQTTDIQVGDWIWVDDIRRYSKALNKKIMALNPYQVTWACGKCITFDMESATISINSSIGDKFHKVDPPKEEVELIEGEVYCCGDLDFLNSFIFVFDKKDEEGGVFSKFQIRIYDSALTPYKEYLTSVERTKLATTEQRKQLFDALEKAGKHFDKENMRLIDVEEWSCEKGLPIIVRNETINWRVDIFHSYDVVDAKYPFLCATCDEEGHPYKYAIPYDKTNADLIGTTDNPDKHYKFVEK